MVDGRGSESRSVVRSGADVDFSSGSFEVARIPADDLYFCGDGELALGERVGVGVGYW